jgi:hypothetical protein
MEILFRYNFIKLNDTMRLVAVIDLLSKAIYFVSSLRSCPAFHVKQSLLNAIIGKVRCSN